MIKKTKVVAFRMPEEEYEGLKALVNSVGVKSIGGWVYHSMLDDICDGMDIVKAERKKAEAKAKRQAKKEAASGL